MCLDNQKTWIDQYKKNRSKDPNQLLGQNRHIIQKRQYSRIGKLAKLGNKPYKAIRVK